MIDGADAQRAKEEEEDSEGGGLSGGPTKKRGGPRWEGKEEGRRENGGPFKGVLCRKEKKGEQKAPPRGRSVLYFFLSFFLSFIFFLNFKRETQQRSPGLARCSSPGWVTASLGRSQLSDRDTVTQEEVSGWTVWIFLGGL